MTQRACAIDVSDSEPLGRYVRRGSNGALWVGSFAAGTLVAYATATLTRTHLDIAVDGRSVASDPGLLPALSDWSTAQGVTRVVAAVAGECDGGLVVGAGFAPGADFLTFGRSMDQRDAQRRPRRHVREVAVSDLEVARLASTGLPHAETRYRPSGAEIIAATVGDPTARAWVVGAPTVGCVVTHVMGKVGVVALIVSMPSSTAPVSDDLLAAALSAMSRDGAEAMRSIVEATNSASRNLNLRYGMKQDGSGAWWHRGPVV